MCNMLIRSSEDTPAYEIKAPWHLWAVGGVSLFWNGFGAFDFTATVTDFEPYMSAFSQEMRDYWSTFPLWKFAIWGVAVWGGVVGSVFLLMRSKIALPTFGLSLAGAAISMITSYSEAVPEGAGDRIFSLVIIGIATLLMWYTYRMSRKGVL
jgi:hypothetical protein